MTIAPEQLRRLLISTEPAMPTLLAAETEAHPGHVLERLVLDLPGKGRVRGLLTRPEGSAGRRPAILYGHSHGGRYDIGAAELLSGREYLLDPLGPILAQAGYVTLAIDMPIFGERATERESAAAKRLLWHGGSLFGAMLADHAAALSYLAARDDVDAERIGAFGMSMGCTLSYWLAAIDARIAAVAHHCCYCDLETLIALGGHDGHGIYLTVPGLLRETTTGEMAGLVAPRPQLICVGADDPLTPPAAVDRAYAQTRAAYEAAGVLERLTLLREPGTAHQETPRMRAALLDFFATWLRP